MARRLQNEFVEAFAAASTAAPPQFTDCWRRFSAGTLGDSGGNCYLSNAAASRAPLYLSIVYLSIVRKAGRYVHHWGLNGEKDSRLPGCAAPDRSVDGSAADSATFRH